MALVIGSGLARLSAILPDPAAHLNDDSFMQFVYARNFAEGRGLVFNEVEHVWGFTSPLFTLLLAAVSFLGGSLPVAAPVFSIALACASGWMWFLIARRHLSALSAVLLGALVANVPIAPGLESGLLMFLQAATLLLLQRGRFTCSALAGSLACLTRPDSVLFSLPILLLGLKGPKLRALVAFSAPGLAWLAFAYLYYGEVLPNTFYGKRGMTPPLRYLAHGSDHLLLPLVTFIRRSFGLSVPNGAGWHAALAVVILASHLLVRDASRQGRALRYALTVYPWLLVLGYALIGSIVGHVWELVSGLVLFTVSWFWGATRLIESALASLCEWITRAEARRAVHGAACCAAVGIAYAAVLPFARDGYRSLSTARHHYWVGARYDSYRAVADWIARNAAPADILATLEPGTISFYSRVAVVDLSYLVTRRRDGVTREGRYPELYLSLGAVSTAKPFGPQVQYDRVAFFPARGYSAVSLLRRVSAAHDVGN